MADGNESNLERLLTQMLEEQREHYQRIETLAARDDERKRRRETYGQTAVRGIARGVGRQVERQVSRELDYQLDTRRGRSPIQQAGATIGTARRGRSIWRAATTAGRFIPTIRTAAALVGGVAAAGYAGYRLLGGGGARGDAASAQVQQQTNVLQALLAESRRSGQTLRQIQVAATVSGDPFGATRSQVLASRQAAGTLITRGEQARLSGLIGAQGSLGEAREARERFRASLRAPMETTIARARTGLLNFGTALQRGFVAGTGDTSRQGGAQAFAGQFGSGFSNLLFTSPGAMGRGRNPIQEYFGGFGGGVNPRLGGRLGSAAGRELFALQTRGPGNILDPSPTARAGTVQDYNVRVRMQREQMQRDLTQDWQDDVLEALRELVELNKATDDDLYKAEIQFNRTTVQPLQAVD